MLTGSTFSETSLWLADDCLCLECSHGLSFVHVCILTESSYKQAAAAAAAKPRQSLNFQFLVVHIFPIFWENFLSPSLTGSMNRVTVIVLPTTVGPWIKDEYKV